MLINMFIADKQKKEVHLMTSFQSKMAEQTDPLAFPLALLLYTYEWL